ncbi:MAG: hypothetical protein JO250_13635 [Armatimonadetes bacterium]|nr:hypothetical protein [Armatimonadota bacterium]
MFYNQSELLVFVQQSTLQWSGPLAKGFFQGLTGTIQYPTKQEDLFLWHLCSKKLERQTLSDVAFGRPFSKKNIYYTAVIPQEGQTHQSLLTESNKYIKTWMWNGSRLVPSTTTILDDGQKTVQSYQTAIASHSIWHHIDQKGIYSGFVNDQRTIGFHLDGQPYRLILIRRRPPKSGVYGESLYIQGPGLEKNGRMIYSWSVADEPS